MRHLLSLLVLAGLPLTALAQTQNGSNQQPVKVSVPSGSIYRGGFSRPIYQGGFAHPIYPDGFARITPQTFFHPASPKPAKPETPVQPTPDAAAAAPLPAQLSPTMAGAADVAAGRAHDDTSHSVTSFGAPTAPVSPPSSVDSSTMPAPVVNAPSVTAPSVTGSPAAPSTDMAAARAALVSRVVAANTPPPAPPPDRCSPRRSQAIATAAVQRTPTVALDGHLQATDTHIRPGDTHLLSADDHPMSSANPRTQAPIETAPADPRETMVGAAPASAAQSLRDHLKSEPDDFHAMRLLAISLLSTKHPQEAADTMAKAYESDPLLAKEPIDLKAAGFEGNRLAALVKSAEDAARQGKSASGWLLAAVLNQAKGSQPQALAALDNSRRLGLNADVSDWLAAELKKNPDRVAQAPK